VATLHEIEMGEGAAGFSSKNEGLEEIEREEMSKVELSMLTTKDERSK